MLRPDRVWICAGSTFALLVASAGGGLAQIEPTRHVLVVTTTTGFRHSSIPVAERVLGELARKSGAFTVEYARVDNDDPRFRGTDGAPDKAKYEPAVRAVLAEKLGPDALKRYDAVAFANTTGDLPLPSAQALLDWIKAGKGFVGIHSASDTFHGFAPFLEMVGGEFDTHGPQVKVDIVNQDRTHPACRHLPATWTVFEEIYQFKGFDRARVHGLLTLDAHPNDRTPGDYPVSWTREYGRGRVFYTSLGHREDIWDPTWTDPVGKRKNPAETAMAYQQHLLAGIHWALGLQTADPRP